MTKSDSVFESWGQTGIPGNENERKRERGRERGGESKGEKERGREERERERGEREREQPTTRKTTFILEVLRKKIEHRNAPSPRN